MPTILGISGYAHAGKDSVGDILVRDFGFERRSVGDVVLDLLAEIDPCLSAIGVGDSLDGARSSVWLAERGYEATKEETDFREMMQRAGAACRRVFGSEVLINATFANCPEFMVMTSTRYRNEAQAIKEYGGYVWRVNREGFGPINDHATEHDMDDWPYDYIIDNDGTLEDLAAKVAEGIERIKNPEKCQCLRCF